MHNKTVTMPASGIATEVVPVRGRVVKSKWARDLLTFLMVVGPGLIVMVADNDAGAVSTYSQAGAQYGPHTYFIQEMVVRLGIATGQGHAAMIYQRFGKWWGLFSLVDLQLLNFLTLVTEFAAIDLALAKLGVDPRAGVPLVAAGLLLIAVTGSYRRWERTVVFLCLLDLAWFFIAYVLRPPFGQIVQGTLVPHMPLGGLTTPLMFLVIAVVGTTVAPWQLFFQQSCIADKRLRFADVKWARLDTLLGATITIVAAGCMMLVGYASKTHGFTFTDPAQMAVDIGSFAGRFFKDAVLLLMINAAVLGTTTISLSSAWAYGEVRGWPHSLQLPVRKAPGFYMVYLLCLAAAAGLVLIPGAPLQLIILGVQVLAGVMLPSAIIFLQLLLNDKELLGEYANKPWNNAVNWTIIIVLFALSLILAAQVAAPNLFPAS
ncbi:Natural resistance-associated macrophage protein [Candidatus Sulfopaludibacter sp. SbA3]|nr:Natural resistance-associated macrophage protein [Candidatus Sulfopaludibacter sp. SbA3]